MEANYQQQQPHSNECPMIQPIALIYSEYHSRSWEIRRLEALLKVCDYNTVIVKKEKEVLRLLKTKQISVLFIDVNVLQSQARRRFFKNNVLESYNAWLESQQSSSSPPGGNGSEGNDNDTDDGNHSTYSFHNPYLSPVHQPQVDYSNNMLIIGVLTCSEYVDTIRNAFKAGMHYYFDIPSVHADYLAGIICDKHYYGNTKSFLEIFDQNVVYDKYHNRNEEFAFIIEYEKKYPPAAKMSSASKLVMPNVAADCIIEENIKPKFGKKPLKVTRSHKFLHYVRRLCWWLPDTML